MVVEGKRLNTVTVNTTLVANSAYAANAVLSNSASAGTAWNFANMGSVTGGTGYLVKTQAVAQANISARLKIYLFNSTPTCNVNNNVASNAPAHADVGMYVGSIDLPAFEAYGGDSTTVATLSTWGNEPLAFECSSTARHLYAIVMTKDVIANIAANTAITIKLTSEIF